MSAAPITNLVTSHCVNHYCSWHILAFDFDFPHRVDLLFLTIVTIYGTLIAMSQVLH